MFDHALMLVFVALRIRIFILFFIKVVLVFSF
jgi:hypothetical protein